MATTDTPPKTEANETKPIKTYEDAKAYIEAKIASGGDATAWQPVLQFFVDRIKRAPALKPTAADPDELVKRSVMARSGFGEKPSEAFKPAEAQSTSKFFSRT